MAKSKKSKSVEASVKNAVPAFVRDTWLAVLGAASLAESEIQAGMKNLIKRGNITEKDGKKIVNDLVKKARQNRILFIFLAQVPSKRIKL